MLDFKKANVLPAVNAILQEFDESPIDSIDFSVPGRIEEKLDVLITNLRLLLIENVAPNATRNEFDQFDTN